MLHRVRWFLFCLGLCSALTAQAQTVSNDGFQRRNGQMHVLRNGQLRPMTRDARLPTGAVVTKDGFVLGRDGRRTELREGQGCDLRGNVVGVVEHNGALALAGPRRGTAAAPPVEQVRLVLNGLLGGGPHYEEYDKKAEEWAREQRKREEELRREAEHKREEHARGKKQKHKWKRGKGWDD
ncbi:hypothetical protein EJV47_21430 [Hymenobacter gummosus]|uniref:DUF6799 domain-containing protein n=1 Tax=Hymenobacter gummosus TaxID=1776032 RepID=A0A431TXD4_9BACT|nr:DUF6799 domain-containing protein [Hymenobacter gummosus]RTQ46517.1 hypothetical protein EJV47_21430 [Hymenobacter gummosus]